MPECVVIADDLTGANATGVLLKNAGADAYSVLDCSFLNSISFNSDDCLIVSTNSRGIEPKAAYSAVASSVSALNTDKGCLICKRIDSTLRGNIGSEITAMLDSLSDSHIAIVVPASPASGRICKEGKLYVNGILLENTAISKDPICPVNTSDCQEIIQKNCEYKICSIKQSSFSSNSDLSEKINLAVSEGYRVIIVDAVTDDDICRISDVISSLSIPVCPVDPGAFTASLYQVLFHHNHTQAEYIKKEPFEKALCIIGSVHENTLKQVMALDDKSIYKCIVNTMCFIDSEKSRNQEIERIVTMISDNINDYQTFCVIGDGLWPDKRLNLQKIAHEKTTSVAEISRELNSAFSSIAKILFDKYTVFHKLYTCGGDISLSVFQDLHIHRIRLIDEVLPLAAFGIIPEGPLAGTRIITKGGSQGQPDALYKCITYLHEH